ncbi:MAG: anti-sigma factor [Erythrobacter sp.]
MSNIKRDDPMIAAEWSLGLLEGEELLAARRKHEVDPDFAWRKEWWDDWFAPLSDEITPAEPSSEVWARIAATINTPAPASEVVELRARVKRWQWVAALTSAAAAIALVFTFASPAPAPQTAAIAPPPLIASMAVGDAGLSMEVTYVPASGQLVVSAAGLAPDGVHDHELWLRPADGGALQSLGVITPGEVRSTALPVDVARNLAGGAQLLLTREPLGGKPAGADAGPVVAQGALAPV